MEKGLIQALKEYLKLMFQNKNLKAIKDKRFMIQCKNLKQAKLIK